MTSDRLCSSSHERRHVRCPPAFQIRISDVNSVSAGCGSAMSPADPAMQHHWRTRVETTGKNVPECSGRQLPGAYRRITDNRLPPQPTDGRTISSGVTFARGEHPTETGLVTRRMSQCDRGTKRARPHQDSSSKIQR